MINAFQEQLHVNIYTKTNNTTKYIKNTICTKNLNLNNCL